MSAQQFQTIMAELGGLRELVVKLFREVEKGSDYHLTAREFRTIATAATLSERKH